jgi:hypothetical protein
MPNRERRKGLEGEREVAAIWRRYDWDVQDLQHNVASLFDQLVVSPRGVILLSDPKRQETLRVPKWIAQAEENAATFADTLNTPIHDGWVIPFRQSGRRKWYYVGRLEDLARLLA